MTRLLTTASLILLLVLPATPALAGTSPSSPSTPGPGGIGIRLLDIPAATQDDPRARSYIVDNLPPGTTIHRRVQVENNTASLQTVQVYPGAARVENGAFVGEDGAAKNELTTWTSVDQPTLTLGPDASANVMVTIAVPANAPEGEQYAAIWAEVHSHADPTTKIVSASRAGIRVYLSVGAGNGPATDFAINSVTASRTPAGSHRIAVALTNTGGRAVDVSGSLTLAKGPGGISAGPFPTATTTTVTPGSHGTAGVTLSPSLPNGPWTVTIALHSGLITHTATTVLTFPPSGQTAKASVSANTPWWLIPAVTVLTLVIASLLLWLLLNRRRLQRDRPERILTRSTE
jgi:hypothetical protein